MFNWDAILQPYSDALIRWDDLTPKMKEMMLWLATPGQHGMRRGFFRTFECLEKRGLAYDNTVHSNFDETHIMATLDWQLTDTGRELVER